MIRAGLALAAALAGSASRPARDDTLDAPTDTGVALADGLWHDDVLVPGHGWHRYTYVAPASAVVAFQMKAPAGHPSLWSYLRIVDARDAHSWAGVANRVTNLCEVLVPVERGVRYEVIATSQLTANLARGARQRTDGPYTIGVAAP